MSSKAITLTFDDNRLLPLLFGEHDRNLTRLEKLLGVSMASFGNQVTVEGPQAARIAAQETLDALYLRLEKQLEVGDAEIDAAVRLTLGAVEQQHSPPAGTDRQTKAKGGKDKGRTRRDKSAAKEGSFASQSTEGTADIAAMHANSSGLETRKRNLFPRSPRQGAYIKALLEKELTFGIGPAGTGKTYLAVASAVTLLLKGEIDRIILSRPAVEAGERLGFLPGDLKEKIDPYLRPLYDALHDMLPGEQVAKRLESGDIEIAPLAFMRGRTLANSYIILDEAQNTTPTQMKMFLTRLGENSRMAVTGDVSQVDLPVGQQSGLRDAVRLLAGIDQIGFVQFTASDVVRHPLVTRIVRAYDRRDNSGGKEVDLFEKLVSEVEEEIIG